MGGLRAAVEKHSYWSGDLFQIKYFMNPWFWMKLRNCTEEDEWFSNTAGAEPLSLSSAGLLRNTESQISATSIELNLWSLNLQICVSNNLHGQFWQVTRMENHGYRHVKEGCAENGSPEQLSATKRCRRRHTAQTSDHPRFWVKEAQTVHFVKGKSFSWW